VTTSSCFVELLRMDIEKKISWLAISVKTHKPMATTTKSVEKKCKNFLYSF
jgi:hypothetical protein